MPNRMWPSPVASPKLRIGALSALLGLALASANACAQTGIQLQSSAAGISFTLLSINSPVEYTVGLNSLCSTGCEGNGPDGTSGFYSLGNGSFTITDVLSGGSATNNWNVSQPSPISFCYSSAAACSGSTFLQGNLNLATFAQPSVDGTFVGILSVTGGTLSGSAFGPSASADLTVIVGVANLSTSGVEALGPQPVLSGSVDPTPEPATIALLGGGFLAVGVVLRRRAQRPGEA